MAQISISKGGHTVASIHAAISTLGYCKVWQGGNITRVYFGNVSAEISGNSIVIANKLKALTGLRRVADAIEVADAAIIEPVTVASKQAENWDNLQNEGHDDGYNPYRRAAIKGYGVSAYTEPINSLDGKDILSL